MAQNSAAVLLVSQQNVVFSIIHLEGTDTARGDEGAPLPAVNKILHGSNWNNRTTSSLLVGEAEGVWKTL